MGVAETLAERAPMMRKVRPALESIMTENVKERTDKKGTRPEVGEVGERSWGELHSG